MIEIMETGKEAVRSIGRVYISGPITGVINYMSRFKAAAEKIKSKGWMYVNPAYNCITAPEASHDQYMHICLAQMDICDAVMMLEGWENSKGAKIEHEYAIQNGMLIMYEHEIN